MVTLRRHSVMPAILQYGGPARLRMDEVRMLFVCVTAGDDRITGSLK